MFRFFRLFLCSSCHLFREFEALVLRSVSKPKPTLRPTTKDEKCSDFASGQDDLKQDTVYEHPASETGNTDFLQHQEPCLLRRDDSCEAHFSVHSSPTL